jgi:hypothetical protein
MFYLRFVLTALNDKPGLRFLLSDLFQGWCRQEEKHLTLVSSRCRYPILPNKLPLTRLFALQCCHDTYFKMEKHRHIIRFLITSLFGCWMGGIWVAFQAAPLSLCSVRFRAFGGSAAWSWPHVDETIWTRTLIYRNRYPIFIFHIFHDTEYFSSAARCTLPSGTIVLAMFQARIISLFLFIWVLLWYSSRWALCLKWDVFVLS